MSSSRVFTVSITKPNKGEVEFRAILSPGEETQLHALVDMLYKADAIYDGGLFPAGADEFLTYEAAVKRISQAAGR
jgi:hypothetical protein